MNKMKSWILVAFAAVGLASVGCSGDPDLPINKGDEQLNVTPGAINFTKDGGEENLVVEAVQGWKLTIADDVTWLAATPETGKEGKTTVTVKALANDGEERAANITFKAGNKEVAIAVKQDGKPIQLTSFATVIEECKKLENRDSKTIEEDWTIRGTVTTDPDGRNNPFGGHGYYYIQNGEEAIIITMAKGTDVKLKKDDEVTITLKGGKLTNFNGAVQVQPASDGDVTSVAGTPVTPKEITVENLTEALDNGKLDGVLVKVVDVQFTNEYKEGDTFKGEEGKTFRANLESKNGTGLTVTLYKNATFRSEKMPLGSGSVIGHASYYSRKPHNIIPRTFEDFDLKGERFTSSEPVKDEVSIDKSSLTVTSDASEADIKVTTSKDAKWSASSDQSWAKVEPAEGTGTTDVKVKVEANEGEERTAKITFKVGDASAILTVVQAAKGGETPASDIVFQEEFGRMPKGHPSDQRPKSDEEILQYIDQANVDKGYKYHQSYSYMVRATGSMDGHIWLPHNSGKYNNDFTISNIPSQGATAFVLQFDIAPGDNQDDSVLKVDINGKVFTTPEGAGVKNTYKTTSIDIEGIEIGEDGMLSMRFFAEEKTNKTGIRIDKIILKKKK